VLPCSLGVVHRSSSTYRRDTLPPSSWSKSKPKQRARIKHSDQRSSDVLGLLFYPDDGGSAFLRNIGELLPDYTVSHPIRQVLFMFTAERTSPPTYFCLFYEHLGSQDSSDGIVMGTQDRLPVNLGLIPGRGRVFSHDSIQTCRGPTQILPVGSGGSFPVDKADHSS
jgi:hypothetical protein